MKKYIMVSVLILFAISLCAQSGNFRAYAWGAAKEDIVKAEGSSSTPGKTPAGLETLAFKGEAGGMECIIGYFFAEGILVQGRYIFTGEHSNRTLYIDDYNKVKASLIEKYGKPKSDDIIWRDNLYKDEPSEWGMAIAVGHLAYGAKWVLSDTEINLQLFGDNHSVTFLLDYQSKLPEHLDLRKKVEAKAKQGIW